MKKEHYYGIVLLVLAELFFAGSTVFAKLLTNSSNIPAIEITFFRFFIGFFISGIYMLKLKQTFKPNNVRFVVLRAVLNTLAVILFFLSVKYTSITNANMLNMTYPVFIFMISPFILKEKISYKQYMYLLLTMLGIYFVIKPDFSNINIGDWYGLASGIAGALAIMSLRMAREYDSTALILFYLMSIGLVINGFLLMPVWVMPVGTQWIFLLSSALAGFIGQAFITSGYKYLEAGKGALVSSSRIVFAFLLGWMFFSESLTLHLIIGASLIVFSFIGVSIDKKSKTI
jgi:drug/metabolite transporter (DMT)-like permease